MRKLVPVGAVAMALACSDGSGPTQTLSLSLATERPSGAASAVAAPSFHLMASDPISDGTNTLIITQAEIVLREIELEREEVADCDDVPEPAGCEDFEVGPVLVDLPLGPGAEQLVAIDAPPGTYNEVEFEVHKVSGSDQEDAAFRQAHPSFPVETSIRVQGTFNGEPFDFRTDLDVEQELDLVPPLVIAQDATSTNLTIMVDLAAWFRALDGTLVNPATGNKGGANESLIKENIKQSVEAFEDEDQDGDDRDEG